MSDNIEIKVTDSIDSRVASKLRAIASEAKAAHNSVELLQTQLSALNASSARLQNELSKTALTEQRLATETKRTEIATVNLSAAQDRAAMTALRLQNAQMKAANGATSMEREAQALRNSLYPLQAAQQAHIASMEKAQRLYRAGVIDLRTYADAIQASNNRLAAAQQPMNGFNAGLANAGKQARLSRHHMLNLGYQIQDIGVSLASGQKPLTVFIQQGAQIAGIMAASEMSAKALAGAIWQLVRPFAPLVAALGAAYASYKLLTNEIAKQHGLEQYAKNLGATQEQIEKLNLDTVTLMDVVKGLWATFGDTTLGDKFLKFLQEAKQLVKGLSFYLVETLNQSAAFLEALAETSGRGYGKRMAGEFSKAYRENLIANRKAFEGAVDEVSSNIGEAAKRRIVDELNKANEKELQTRLKNRAAMLAKINLELDNELSRMFMLKNEREGQARLDQIQERFVSRNMALNSQEISQLKQKIDLIRSLVSVQAKQDSLIEKLTGAQKEASASMIALGNIAAEGYFKGAEGADKFQALVDMTSENLRKATESQYEFNKQREKQALLNGLVGDQLQIEMQVLDMKQKALNEGNVFYEQATRNIVNMEFETKKLNDAVVDLYNTYAQPRKDIQVKIQAIQEMRNPEDRPQAVSDMLGGMGADTTFFASQLAAEEKYYQERLQLLENFRQKKLATNEEVAAAELQIEFQRQQKYLNASSNFFGDLSTLQKLENKKAFKIGKAAAIAQATVNTYNSATAAYASLAGIPLVGPALGATAAGAAVVAGLINVAAIRAQEPGFMLGGYTGNVGRREVAGVVHGQEYVFDAEATSRIGVDNLEALRNSARQMGSSSAKSATSGIGGVVVNIENYGVSKQFEVQQVSRDEIRVIARDEAEASVARVAPNVIASDIANPNGKVSKALAASTTTTRRR